MICPITCTTLLVRAYLKHCSESLDKPCLCLDEIWKLWLANQKGEEYRTSGVPWELKELILKLTGDEMEALSDAIQDICYVKKNAVKKTASKFDPAGWQEIASKKLSPFRLKMLIELAKRKKKGD